MVGAVDGEKSGLIELIVFLELAHLESYEQAEEKALAKSEQEIRNILSGTFYMPDVQVTGIIFKQGINGQPSRAQCEFALSLPPGVDASQARDDLENAVRSKLPPHAGNLTHLGRCTVCHHMLTPWIRGHFQQQCCVRWMGILSRRCCVASDQGCG